MIFQEIQSIIFSPSHHFVSEVCEILMIAMSVEGPCFVQIYVKYSIYVTSHHNYSYANRIITHIILNVPSNLEYKSHLIRPGTCWSLRCSWIIACRRCPNYIFILHFTHGFNGLGKNNCKTIRESFKCWDLVRLILEIYGTYIYIHHIFYRVWFIFLSCVISRSLSHLSLLLAV